MLEVLIIFALFAAVFPIGKVALLYSQPIFLTAARMIFAGVMLIGYHWYNNPQRVQVTFALVGNIVLLSLFNIYLTNVCEFWGLQYLSAAKTSFIYNLSPFASAFLSYLFFNERMTMKKWLGLMIGFLGFIPLLLQSTNTEELLGGIGFLSWAELSLITAAIATVLGWIVMRQVVLKGMSVLYANGWSMLIGGLGALLTSYVVEPWSPYPYTDPMLFLWYMLILMLISNIFCYNIYAYLLRSYTATFLTFAGFTTPLWAAFYGWLFLNESISNAFVLSSITVFIGLYMFYSEEIRLGSVHHH